MGRVTQKRIQIKDKNAFGHIQQNMSTNHLLHQFSTRQIDLEWDEQNQLSASTSTKPDGRGRQEIIETQYCYDPFGRRIAKQSQIYKKELVTQQIKLKTQPRIIEDRPAQNNFETSNQLGSSINLSLGGGNGNISQPSALGRSISQPATKTVRKEQTLLIQKQAVWNVWDGNRILQDYNGKHVFTTVYEADAFVPLARLVWLEDKLTEAANDENVPKVDIAKLDQLKQIALQNIGELEGLDSDQTFINQASNDEPPKHSKHQVYWYQNDHLGTPRELTSNSGNIEWEAVYQAWGNTVTVEWEEVAQVQELNPIQLNGAEQSYLLQPHRFQGQIYDVETGLHYNRFRYYDPDAGRFISHDPIGLVGGYNPFFYALNPIEWVDPLGLKTILASIFADINKWSLAPISDRQKGMIKDKLSTTKQRSKELTKLMRDDFKQKEKDLIKEWEKETGQTWPTCSNGKRATPHHAIPLKNGGTNEWWNMIPVKHPHTGTLHGSGSALNVNLPYKQIAGHIFNLLGKAK